MDFQLVQRRLVVIVNVVRHLEHVTNVVQRLINIHVVVLVIKEEVEQYVKESM